MGVMLDGFPTWSQNADPEPNGQADPFAATDCGEECCSIVLYGQMKAYTTAGQVRRMMQGHSDHGETTSNDIAFFLENAGTYPLTQYKVGADLKAAIKRAVNAGSPVITLGHFLSPNVLHWVVVIGFGNDHVLYIDPWYGRLEARHWLPFLGLCAGQHVVSRTRSQAT